jgi:hypothetical protein
MGAATETIYSKDTSGGDVPGQIPFSAWSGEVIIDDSASACARVEYAVAANVDRYVVDAGAPGRKQQEVARLKRLDIERERLSRCGLEPGSSGELDPMSTEDVLHKPRAVEADRGGSTSIAIVCAQIPLGSGEHSGRAGTGRARPPDRSTCGCSAAG